MTMLTGKTCMITGSNRGLGKAIVKKLAECGADIIAHARCKNEIFESEMQKIAADNNIRVTNVYFDMTDSISMKNAILEIYKKGITIDILVNNAGVAHGGLLQMTKISTIKEVFDVNFFSQLELSQLVVRKMICKGNGCIINMSSIAGIEVNAGNCAYGTSKAALIAATKAMAAEFTPLGIRVNAIAPGLVDTNMAEQMEDKAYKNMVSASFMNRLGSVEEIANIVAFLASDEASFISGQVIKANGGSIYG